MLVLSRHKNESIMIGDGIEVTVVDIRGDKARIGIICPADIPVHRQEVYDAIQRENRIAQKNIPSAYSDRDISNLFDKGDYDKISSLINNGDYTPTDSLYTRVKLVKTDEARKLEKTIESKLKNN